MGQDFLGMAEMFKVALVVQLASCAMMVGVIFIVQLILYPAFLQIDSKNFSEFHRRHTSLISWIVIPPMLFELCSSVFLVVEGSNHLFWTLNLIGVLAIWSMTGFYSVPCHQKLKEKFAANEVHRLTTTNWGRTVLWTARLVFLIWFLISEK